MTSTLLTDEEIAGIEAAKVHPDLMTPQQLEHLRDGIWFANPDFIRLFKHIEAVESVWATNFSKIYAERAALKASLERVTRERDEAERLFIGYGVIPKHKVTLQKIYGEILERHRAKRQAEGAEE